MADKRIRRQFTAELQRLHRDGSPDRATSTPAPQVGNPDLFQAVGEILDGLIRLEGKFERLGRNGVDGNGQVEADDTAEQVTRTMAEIAALRHPKAEQDRLVAATKELAAIVQATEAAANDIFKHVESIEIIADAIRQAAGDDVTISHMEDVTASVTAIYEAMSFQDITGQRVRKVVNTLEFIENRVTTMIDIWGQEAFAALPLPEDGVKTEDARLLNGPQIDQAEAMGQGDIDALFD